MDYGRVAFDCGAFAEFLADLFLIIIDSGLRVFWCVSSHICASSQVSSRVWKKRIAYGSSAVLADVDALLPRGTVCYYYLIRLKRFSTAFDAFLSHLPFRGGGCHFSEIKTFMSAASKNFGAAPRPSPDFNRWLIKLNGEEICSSRECRLQYDLLYLQKISYG